MKESAIRACAGCISAVLGLALVVASSYQMYTEEMKMALQARSARNALGFAQSASCDTVDVDLKPGMLVYLHGCKVQTTLSLADLQATAESTPATSIGAYRLCPQQPPVDLKLETLAAEGAALQAGSVPAALPACAAAAAPAGTVRKEVETASVIAVLGSDAELLRVLLPHTDVTFLEEKGPRQDNGWYVIAPGDIPKSHLTDYLHMPRFAPKWLIISLVFAGVFAMNLGLAEIPGHRMPSACRVPQFQSCTVSLMSTLAVMITLCVSGVLVGVAWAHYHPVLALPLFVASLTSLCLLVFVRFRCSYDGYDDEEEEETKEGLLRDDDDERLSAEQ